MDIVFWEIVQKLIGCLLTNSERFTSHQSNVSIYAVMQLHIHKKVQTTNNSKIPTGKNTF